MSGTSDTHYLLIDVVGYADVTPNHKDIVDVESNDYNRDIMVVNENART